MVARHPFGIAGEFGAQINGERDGIAGEHRSNHERTELLIDRLQRINVRKVQYGHNCQGQPPGRNRINAVGQPLAPA